MDNQDAIPASQIEQAEMLERMLIDHATGGVADNEVYRHLRREFMNNAALCTLLPQFVNSCRDVDAFWSYIKQEAHHMRAVARSSDRRLRP